MGQSSHHPRLIHKEEKKEEDDSDDQQFSVHEFCLSDRAEVILPCLPQLASTEHLEILKSLPHCLGLFVYLESQLHVGIL